MDEKEVVERRAVAEVTKPKRIRVRTKIDPIAALRAATAAVAEHRKGVAKVIAFHQGKIDEARALLAQLDDRTPEIAERAASGLVFNGKEPRALKALVKLPLDFTMDLAKKRGLLPINIAQLVRRGVIKKIGDGQYSKVAQ